MGQGAVRMGLEGANPAAAVRGHERQEGRANYLLGGRSRWRTELPLYAGVEYRDVYPGVSLILYGNGRELEYDFLLAPGARPDSICMSFEGVKSMRVKEGGLVLETPSGQMRHRRPRIYQQFDGRKVEIPGRFVLRGPRRAGFVVERYDKTRPLVIDPVLVYGTYVGGSGDDRAWAIAVDAAGCAYVAGETWSANFPRTFNFSHSAGNLDAFLIKLNAAGTAVLYATYFGGASRDSARGVAVDAAGNAYVTGSSSSADFPTTSGAYRTSPAGLDDAFVVKLNATGSSLLYATLLGGAGSDLPTGIAVDSSGNAYIAGYTNSLSFPVTTGAFQKNFGGGWQDAFAAKLNASGSGLVYATYLGGQGNDMANGIAVDSLGFAYIGGYTDSSNFPLCNALRASAAGQGDGFVVKLNPAGNGLAYATYLGGTQADTVTAVAVDANGNAYVTGSTFSRDFPVTAGAFQVAGQGSVDAFVSKLNPQGNALVYSTFVGGEASEEAESIAVDAGGIAYIAGWTDSLKFPLQTPLDAAPHGGRDAFVAALAAAGNSLSWSTYLGGAAEDRAMGVALGSGNNVYTAGYTLSPDFRTTQGAYRTASTAGDAFVMKLSAAIAQPSAAATFVKMDVATQGSWKQMYGAEGAVIAADSTQFPAYAQVTVAGQGQAVWASTTVDARALQKSSTSERMASTWYSNSNFTIDVNPADSTSHQIGLYCIDWDGNGRIERIDLLDATSGAVLDSRTVLSFSGGQYFVWNVSGHVTFRVTAVFGNAVVSGIFFGGGTPATQPSGATAAFQKVDSATQGSWKGVYGTDGAAIAGDSSNYPAYAQVAMTGQGQALWTTNTSDARAVQKLSGSGRIVAAWYSNTNFSVDITITDGAAHQIAVYCLDWDGNNGRASRIDVLDAASGTVLDSRTVASFSAGQYLVWNVSGHVTFRVTAIYGNAVVSGIFFGGGSSVPQPSASTAVFQKTDSATQGSWKGVYGADGAAIAADSSNFPAYAQVAMTGQGQALWATNTTDARGVLKLSGSGRIASAWYSNTNFSLDIAITDGAAHQVGVYCLDWDGNNGRTGRIDVLDAASGTVLDSRTVASFSAGQYLIWTISGHVILRATAVYGNVVMSGIFFGGSSGNTPPSFTAATFQKTDFATQGTWKGVYGTAGAAIAYDSTNYPSYAQVTIAGQGQVIWTNSTLDVRGMQKYSGSGRIASAWYSNSNFTMNIGFTGSGTHQVALYCVDWDGNNGRSQRIEVLDAASGAVLDSRTVSSFSAGVYLVWNVSGNIIFRISSVAGNALVGGLLFQ